MQPLLGILLASTESSRADVRVYLRQYHKAVLNLFTVLLPSLDSVDPRFITSARSAGCVCIAYKRLNQQKTLSYTMISLHSCFVAGLTLMYCLWRDRSLFSFDVLEASRACSQSLTIFGEKWPGAVKYRDIFDALSGSLLKTIVNPATSAAYSGGSRTGPQPLRIDLDGNLGLAVEGAGSTAVSAQGGTGLAGQPNEPRTQQGGQSSSSCSFGKPTMIHMVSDAVKEAFMEVDEEAPGGWQGWRMWNEMITDNEGWSESGFVHGFDGADAAQPPQSSSSSWRGDHDGPGNGHGHGHGHGQSSDGRHSMFRDGMTQNENMAQYRAMEPAGWNFGELGGL